MAAVGQAVGQAPSRGPSIGSRAGTEPRPIIDRPMRIGPCAIVIRWLHRFRFIDFESSNHESDESHDGSPSWPRRREVERERKSSVHILPRCALSLPSPAFLCSPYDSLSILRRRGGQKRGQSRDLAIRVVERTETALRSPSSVFLIRLLLLSSSSIVVVVVIVDCGN